MPMLASHRHLVHAVCVMTVAAVAQTPTGMLTARHHHIADMSTQTRLQIDIGRSGCRHGGAVWVSRTAQRNGIRDGIAVSQVVNHVIPVHSIPGTFKRSDTSHKVYSAPGSRDCHDITIQRLQEPNVAVSVGANQRNDHDVILVALELVNCLDGNFVRRAHGVRSRS